MTSAMATVFGWFTGLWLLVQSTVAATVAWLIATQVPGRETPFFAPIVALIVLNFARGERGLYAVRLVFGVAAGIACAELAVAILGGGYVSLAAATFAAMAVVATVTRNRLSLNQAGAAAVLTVAFAGGEAGLGRMIDAMIGAGVAVVFTQAVFSPEPIALVRRAETTALAGMAEGLARTAEGLERGADATVPPVAPELRGIREALAMVGWAGVVSQRIVRRGLVWRHRAAQLAQVIENAVRLELLGASCVMLMRSAVLAEPATRRELAGHVWILSGVMSELAADPGGHTARQRAVDRSLGVSSGVQLGDAPVRVPAVAAQASLGMVAFDVLVFAGIDPEVARAVVRKGKGELVVTGVPQGVRFPFSWWGRLR